MVLTYDRVLQLLLVAYSIGDVCGNRISIHEQKLTLKYSDYVKSQLHLPVISGFYEPWERSIFQYANALDYLEGDQSKREDALIVARYYYEDMANFLLKNRSEVHLTTDLSELGLADVHEDFKTLKAGLLKIIKKSALEYAQYNNDATLPAVDGWDDISLDSNKSLTQMISEFPYSDIIDYCDGGKENYKMFIQNLENYLHASILKKYAKAAENDSTAIVNLCMEV